mgnify:CR=1 FL=1
MSESESERGRVCVMMMYYRPIEANHMAYGILIKSILHDRILFH